MKTVSLLALVFSCWLLTACQGSSNSGSTTTTTSIANNCVRNNMGQLVNPQTGMACGTGGLNGQCVMTAQGYYINQMTGQICNQAQAGYYGAGGYGGYGGGYGGDPCAYATQMYGQQYYYQNGVCINPYGY